MTQEIIGMSSPFFGITHFILQLHVGCDPMALAATELINRGHLLTFNLDGAAWSETWCGCGVSQNELRARTWRASWY